MKKGLSILMAALLCLFFVGCDASKQNHVVKTGFVGSSTSDRWTGWFKSYNGTESKAIRAKKGMELVLTFALAAEEGELYLTAEGPDGIQLLNTRSTGVMDGKWNIVADRNLRLRMHGEGAKNGSFTLAWEFRPQAESTE